ncbi:MAG TPA: hypothetical protein VIM98_06140 [Dyella sp.]|uniref:hypothetical protein n=1 Tax=Dyella sp. TaxID=1869338 RepID=UPI002F92B060
MKTTIVISYFEVDDDGATLLGQETHEDISSALLPGQHHARVFFVKEFAGLSHRRWEVLHVTCLGPQGAEPARFQVYLYRIFSQTQEVYFKQSKQQPGAQRYLRKGTLVEVDYGHVPSLATEQGTRREVDGYNDTRQHGEMHKRRLAVVVNMTPNAVQVVPATSVFPQNGGKTFFEIDPGTLARLSFYGSSKKQSWVICSMIETVSFARILPPESLYTERGVKKSGRSVQYPVALSSRETKLLDDALLHSVGVTDYAATKARVANLYPQLRRVEALEAQVVALRLQTQVHTELEEEFRVLREVAEALANRAGLRLEQEIKEHMEIKELLAANHQAS